MTDVIPIDQLQRYLAMRARCDAELKTIVSLATMLTYLDSSAEPTLKIDPFALAHTQHLIAQSALTVLEALEDFVSKVEAMHAQEVTKPIQPNASA